MDNKNYFVHESSFVDAPCEIGDGTKIWHFSHIMKNSKIGKNCNIGQNVVVSPDVILGDNVKVQNNVSIYTGVICEDDVFLGPSMVFTNVVNPRSHVIRKDEYQQTLMKKGSSVGANAVIICGNTMGKYSFIGAGAVVTKDVPDYALMVGNPARRAGWMCECGIRLNSENTHDIKCKSCGKSYEQSGDSLMEKTNTNQGQITVPLLDLKAQYNTIRTKIEPVIKEVVESQYFILGPKVKELEEKIAAYSDTQYGIGVSSGTDALLIALMAIDIKEGDEIITTPYSFFATAGVIARLGAKPVFVDIEPDYFNIDPSKIENIISPKTKAIIPVHLYGQMADMNSIMEIAKKHNLYVIEDAAQAIGSKYHDERKAGSIGHMGCFSFFPSKNLGGFGDAGMVVTNDSKLAEKLVQLRVHGSAPKYFHKIIGGNFRIDALQAAVLSVKLDYLDKWTHERQKNAEYYNTLFKNAELDSIITLPKINNNYHHIFNQYILRVPQRDELLKYLHSNNIGCEIYYPLSLSNQECFLYLGYNEGAFPESEKASKETIAIPIYPEISHDQQKYIVDKIKAFYS